MVLCNRCVVTVLSKKKDFVREMEKYGNVLGFKSLEQLANREHTRTYKLQKEDFRICLI